MSWWGKVLGGTFGFMMAGPLGALLGAALGNYFDGGLDSIGLDDSLGPGMTERVQSVFFATTFTVMGYVAKADGRVTRDEIKLAEQVMDNMRLGTEQRKVAINLFNEGKKPDFPLTEVLHQFRSEVLRRRNLVQMFLEIQIATAMADGELDVQEKNCLQDIAAAVGFRAGQFEALLGRVSGQAHFMDEVSLAAREEAAYELLGVDSSASDAELKRAYRRQMNQHHPDKLVAKGLPEEMVDLATQKTQEIKEAYELLKEKRGSDGLRD